MDHYSTLGVERTATAEEIKAAYRRMALKHHPDRGGDTASFQRIEEAYRTLSDPQTRSQYDNPMPEFSGNFDPFGRSGFDFDSIFNMFGARFNHNMRPQARIQIVLDLQDIVHTRQQLIQVNTPQGSHTVEITVPQGIEDGDTVQYPNAAPGGIDLIVTFKIRPDARWTRKGPNLITHCNLTFWELIVGISLPIVGLHGEKLSVEVPAQTAPNTQLRLRGQGLPDRNGTRGDIVVKLIAVMPDSISAELMAAIRQEMVKN